jgi:hypothetical protein
MAAERGTIDLVLRYAFLTVAVVAGLVGSVMVVAPESTDDYFSWALGPPPLAALVGGLYVASTVVFGIAASRPWSEARGLVLAVLALTLPTLVATLVHAEVFDFSRAVAIVWIVLFVASPLIHATVLYLRRGVHVERGPALPVWLRAFLAGLSALLVVLALLCWLDRPSAESVVPFALAPMGAAFLGAWSLFLAVLAGWPAIRGGWTEARIPLLGLVAYPLGGAVAALRTADDLEPGGGGAVYAIALCAVAAVAAYGLRSGSAWHASTSPGTAIRTPTR